MDSYNTKLISDPSNIQLLKRLGMMYEIRPECLNAYRMLHAEDNKAIRDLLLKYHMRNYSMFLKQIENRWLVFVYCEYVGRDFVSEMKSLNMDVRYQEWQNAYRMMHDSSTNNQEWNVMEQIFFNP
jgi:L-rhamnose mutarotase